MKRPVKLHVHFFTSVHEMKDQTCALLLSNSLSALVPLFAQYKDLVGSFFSIDNPGPVNCQCHNLHFGWGGFAQLPLSKYNTIDFALHIDIV